MLAACSGGGDDVVVDGDDVARPTTTAPADFVQVATTAPERPTFADGPLSEVCPSVISIQLDDLPSVEHGPLIALLGPDAAVDPSTGRAAATLVRPDGTIEDGVELDIRVGGPVVDFRRPLDLLASDPTLLIAQASTEQLLRGLAEAEPTSVESVSVAALTDRSHRMIMWDPATYPTASSIADLGALDVEIRHQTADPFIEYLVDQGIVDTDQLVDGFFGEPARFVAEAGASAQQGDVLVDPALYPALPQWGQEIAFSTASDAGWVGYDDHLVVRRADIATLSACLGRLVPIVQDAIVAYVEDSTPINATMIEMRAAFDPLSRLSVDILDRAVADGVAAGVFANGADGAVASVDTARVASFLTALAADGAEVAVTDIVTNDFVRPDRSL
jgi:hypothetical protein